MMKRMPSWCMWMVMGSLVAGAAAVSCGGSDSKGTGADGTGGRGDAGSTGEAGAGPGTGTGGRDTTPITEADIDELIAEVCDWEFRCCSAGELDYRFGPFSESAERCTEQFIFQLRESNATNNPFPGGAGLLGTLGYAVDLDRVEPNPEGIAACLEQYAARGCAEHKPAEPARCEGPAEPGSDPCALNNLFHPKLGLGERCTLSLAEGVVNDIECLPGSTCLPAEDPANDADHPACVQRGTSGQPCTQDGDCDFNLFCGDNGQCQEKGSAGDDCAFSDTSAPAPGEESVPCKAGLSCNPNTLKCTDNCSLGHVCTDNLECPAGASCAPLTVTISDDPESFHACRELGDTNTSRCDDDDDCDDTRYCSANNCVSKVAVDGDCSTQGECPEGTFCDTSTVTASNTAKVADETCKAYFVASTACYPYSATAGYPSGCGPEAPYCLFDEDDSAWSCSGQLRAAGASCHMLAVGEPSECQAGLHCEAVDLELDWPYQCTAGAELGDDCDEIRADDEALDCGAGLTCKEGKCVAQSDPGGDCEDLDTPGVADAVLCKNSDCVEQWDDLICSDAPVPESAGGANLTCGG